jgi:hypothetical protein
MHPGRNSGAQQSLRARADCPSGCTTFLAGSFSSRVMWRAKGNLMSYMYYPGKTEVCGDNWLWDEQAIDGEWTFQKTYVRLNTIGARPHWLLQALPLPAPRWRGRCLRQHPGCRAL